MTKYRIANMITDIPEAPFILERIYQEVKKQSPKFPYTLDLFRTKTYPI